MTKPSPSTSRSTASAPTPRRHPGRLSATAEINRQDFGVSYNGPIPGADNAMVLSDKIALNIEVEAVLRQPAAK